MQQHGMSALGLQPEKSVANLKIKSTFNLDAILAGYRAIITIIATMLIFKYLYGLIFYGLIFSLLSCFYVFLSKSLNNIKTTLKTHGTHFNFTRDPIKPLRILPLNLDSMTNVAHEPLLRAATLHLLHSPLRYA